jgi:uncharacterized cupin superfamily protein
MRRKQPRGVERDNRSARPRGSCYDVAMSTSLVVIDISVAPEVSHVSADRLVAGNPVTRVANYFGDATQQFFAGRWAATRGKWRVRYTENELCVMTSGAVVIQSEAGERRTFVTGDAFVVPAGFSGTWEVLEDCSKIYAVFDAATPAGKVAEIT